MFVSVKVGYTTYLKLKRRPHTHTHTPTHRVECVTIVWNAIHFWVCTSNYDSHFADSHEVREVGNTQKLAFFDAKC